MAKRIYFNTEETTTTVKKGYLELDEDFTQVYKTIAEISHRINNGVSWKILFWLLSNNNDNNGVIIDKDTYKRFILYLEGHNSTIVSRPTFDRSVKELLEAGVLTKVGKGHYYLNPYIFWQNDKQSRVEFITSEVVDGTTKSLNPVKSDIIKLIQ